MAHAGADIVLPGGVRECAAIASSGLAVIGGLGAISGGSYRPMARRSTICLPQTVSQRILRAPTSCRYLPHTGRAIAYGKLGFRPTNTPTPNPPTRGRETSVGAISENCLPFDAKEEIRAHAAFPPPCGEG